LWSEEENVEFFSEATKFVSILGMCYFRYRARCYSLFRFVYWTFHELLGTSITPRDHQMTWEQFWFSSFTFLWSKILKLNSQCYSVQSLTFSFSFNEVECSPSNSASYFSYRCQTHGRMSSITLSKWTLVLVFPLMPKS